MVPSSASSVDASEVSASAPVDPPLLNSSSPDHWQVNFHGHDFVLPDLASRSSKGGTNASSISWPPIFSSDPSSLSGLPLHKGEAVLLHKGDAVSLLKGGSVASHTNLGIPAFVNPDTVGLQRLLRPHMPKILTSMFLLFGFLTQAAGLPSLSADANVV